MHDLLCSLLGDESGFFKMMKEWRVIPLSGVSHPLLQRGPGGGKYFFVGTENFS